MMTPRFIRAMIAPLLVLVTIPGCQLFPSYRPAPVLVRDAETGQPIAGADVRLSYIVARAATPPAESIGLTGGDGIARLRAAPNGDTGAILNVNAPSYLGETLSRSDDDINALKRAGWFEDVALRPAAFVVELYAEPHPVVELIVPPTFRGIVKIRLHPKKELQAVKGQRVFGSGVPASGIVDITGPLLLQHVNPLDFRAKFPDGKRLEKGDDHDGIGFWWLKCDEDVQWYFVGTRREFEAAGRLQRYYDSRPASSSGPSSSSGQGRSRRGRRGSADLN